MAESVDQVVEQVSEQLPVCFQDTQEIVQDLVASNPQLIADLKSVIEKTMQEVEKVSNTHGVVLAFDLSFKLLGGADGK